MFLALLLVSIMQGAFLNVWQIKPAQATVLINEDFENWNVNGWTINNVTGKSPQGVYQTTAAAFLGTYGLNLTYVAADSWMSTLYVSKDFTLGQNWTIGLRFRPDLIGVQSANDGSGMGIVRIMCEGQLEGWNFADFRIQLNSTGYFWWGSSFSYNTSNYATTNYTNSYLQFTPNNATFYKIVVKMRQTANNGTDGWVSYNVDGVELFNHTNLANHMYQYGSYRSLQRVELGLRWHGAEPNAVTIASYDSLELATTPEEVYGETHSDVHGLSQTFVGVTTMLYSFWTPTLGETMEYFIAGTNNTGAFTNQTVALLSGDWGNYSFTVNSTAITIQINVWANDSSGNWYSLGFHNIAVTNPFPSFSNISAIGRASALATNISVFVTATGGTTLGAAKFCWNVTGAYVNASSTTLSGLSAWYNLSTVLDTAAENWVNGWFYASNNLGQWSNSTNMTFPVLLSSRSLYTEGNKIFNGDGQFNIKGVHYNYWIDSPNGSWVTSSGTVEYLIWDRDAARNMMDISKIWGANTWRIHVNEEWCDNDTLGFWTYMKLFLDDASARGLYIIFDLYCQAGGNLTAPSAGVLADSWFTIASEIKGYDNIVFNIWNEPAGDTEANFQPKAQASVEHIRATGATQPIVYQQNYGVWVDFYSGYPPNAGGDLSWITEYPVTDVQNNIIYDVHLYRYGGFFNSSKGYEQVWTYYDMSWALNVTGVRNASLYYPVMVGEIGASAWWSDSTNQTREIEWYNNTLQLLKEMEIGYISFWFWPIGMYQQFSGAFIPNKYAQPLINQINEHPFVWSSGLANNIYSDTQLKNHTGWTGSKISISLSATTQTRVYWNASASYPINASLQIQNTTGLYSALDFYDYTTNLIRWLGVGVQELGYNLEGLSAYSVDVTLDTPLNGANSITAIVYFTYLPTVRGDVFLRSELWLNLSGIYQIAAYNSSLIANYTTNSISYAFPANNTYLWNIKIWNSTTGVFASSNRILTVGFYVALPRYYLNVVDKDLDLNTIDAYCTQQFLNGSTILTYTEGESSLLAGTITIKTYYLAMLVNSTDFDIPAYGDSTVTIYLNMKALSMGGFLAVNKTAAITFKNQTDTLINASITAAGTFQVACLVPANATLVQLDGVNVTDWLFNATNLSLRANLTSGDFSMTFAETLGEPWFGVTVGLVSLGSLGGAIWYYRRAAKKKSKVVPAS